MATAAIKPLNGYSGISFMRNSPVHSRFRSEERDLTRGPVHFRLAILFGIFVILFSLIATRVAWLKVAARDDYLALWDRTTESWEPIPARDGSILTADGTILAFDEVIHDVNVHYRWLESPPDEGWLRQQIRLRLKNADDKSDARQQAVRQQILQEREDLRRNLAQVLGISRQELIRRLERVQNRVETIVASVERRRKERQHEARHDPQEGESQPQGLWQRIMQELTTPPRRSRHDPIVIVEELQYHTVAKQVSLSVVTTIQSYPSRFPGVEIRMATRRTYPSGDLASHIVGVRKPVRGEERHARTSAASSALLSEKRVGRSGIEQMYDDVLRGKPGVRRVVRNRRGEIVDSEVVREPIDGHDVVLTLDAFLQRTAERLLDSALGPLPETSTDVSDVQKDSNVPSVPMGGALVALDVRTGAVLTAAAAPRYDAQLLTGASQESWDRAAGDPRRPFFPRVTQAVLPPGSVFKTLTSVALIESGVIDPEATYHCRGYLHHPGADRCLIFRKYGVGHGEVTLEDALCRSCNVYFFHAAERMGVEPILTWAQRFGLGQITGVDLPGEQPGALPDTRDPSGPDHRWHPGTTRQLAVGQGPVTVTPLQVARMMAALANDGWLVTPRFLERVGSHPSQVPTSGKPGTIQLLSYETGRHESRKMKPVRIAGLSPGTLQKVRDGLLRVVEHPQGTGSHVRLAEITIAGKTGTAETGTPDADHAWFAGYVPADAPRIAFVVVLEHGGSGGEAAGPIVREFVRGLLERRFLQETR